MQSLTPLCCYYLIMSLAIKIGVVVLGLVFYFFAISTLLTQRRDKAEQQVLFDSIDFNGDGVITTQEINSFRPCVDSNRSKLVARLNSIGPSVTFDQFEQDVNKNMIKYALAPCAANAHLFANPAEISKRTTANTVEPFFAMYDLNKDGNIKYNQYQLVNKFHGRSIKGSTQTFVYLDSDNDWILTRPEVTKAKLANLDPKLPDSLRRKPRRPRHGHHAPAAPTGAGVGAGAATAAGVERAKYAEPRYENVYDEPRQRAAPRIQQYYEPQRDVYSADYAVGAGQYDIVLDSQISASERIQRERRRAREAQYRERERYYEPQASRGYNQRTYRNERAYERPIRDEYARPQQPRQNERLDATGRLDTLSGPRPREAGYRERGYEYGL